MSFFHKKNVTKCLGHHYAIWTSDSNFLLAQKKISVQPKAGSHLRHCFGPLSFFKGEGNQLMIWGFTEFRTNKKMKI